MEIQFEQNRNFNQFHRYTSQAGGWRWEKLPEPQGRFGEEEETDPKDQEEENNLQGSPYRSSFWNSVTFDRDETL